MKKLLFIILLFSANILTFGDNVYFLNSGTGYLYTNEQTFYSIQQGYAPVAYHIWADPAKYNHEGGVHDLKTLPETSQNGVNFRVRREYTLV